MIRGCSVSQCQWVIFALLVTTVLYHEGVVVCYFCNDPEDKSCLNSAPYLCCWMVNGGKGFALFVIKNNKKRLLKWTKDYAVWRSVNQALFCVCNRIAFACVEWRVWKKCTNGRWKLNYSQCAERYAIWMTNVKLYCIESSLLRLTLFQYLLM